MADDLTTAHRWDEARFTLARRQELSRSAGGAVFAADLGGPLWRAEFRSFPLRRDPADALLADFEDLGGAVGTFLAHPAKRPRPASSPVVGPALAGVTVDSIAADRRSLVLAGLPAGFVLGAGDFVSIATAAGGREFLRLAGGGAAVTGGDSVVRSPSLRTTQPIRPSVAAGDAATLADPLVEMRIEPGTLAQERVALDWWSVVFSCVQVVR
ncbi:MAG: hypothetical protein ACU0E9_07755 [Limimaricola soesokkakensis]|uniref:hypothetical protein n=1 Tax=Limimaricola soesokkakensis TaxID=1343159 RepID=UPI004059B38C